MAERDELLMALVAEVLGPRDGPLEILPNDQNPLDEYITGILAPKEAGRSSRSIEAEADDLSVEDGGGDASEDESPSSHAVVADSFSSALDPKALPSSIGLSFTLEYENGTAAFEACCTWARYLPVENGWQRHPASFLTGPVETEDRRDWDIEPGVSLSIRTRPVSETTVRVSLFLVNTLEIGQDSRPETEHHIFQPQIRVACRPGSVLLPVRGARKVDPPDSAVDSLVSEESSLDFIYRDHSALARGHLCSAVWKDIDPQRASARATVPDRAPFVWADQSCVDESVRDSFAVPDARTELVPCYPIAAPDMEWDEAFGDAPVLGPEQLSEAWTREEMANCLLPLAEGYEAWIRSEREKAQGLAEGMKGVGNLHLEHCEQSLDRIREAVNILESDEDVRLAFCFANKAIALQSNWARGSVMNWRPFQLAFILLNVAALADPRHDDRDICDLLWFPTGGGKTEAYLGLVAFTIGLRRLRAKHEGNPGGGDGTAVISRYTLRLLTIQQFRRALRVITACEFLRVVGLDSPAGPVGWRPKACSRTDTFIWGGTRFAAGLWVGAGVTPNSLLSIGPIFQPSGRSSSFIAGAIDILKGARVNYDGPDEQLRKTLKDVANVVIGGEPRIASTKPLPNANGCLK